MDINTTTLLAKPQLKVEQLQFKINQLVEIKVISSKPPLLNTKTIPSNHSLVLEGNLPVKFKPGQALLLVVNKTSPTLEFKLSNENQENKGLIFKSINSSDLSSKSVQNPSSNQTLTHTEQKILTSLKQLLPIQQSPTELLNQLILALPLLTQNKQVSQTLKRLAKEILQQTPLLKKADTTLKIKQLLTQSGLFLEAKLATNSPIHTDKKALLLKFKHELKRHLSQSKLTVETDLIKDIQQKTEASLARLILNQLSSLPKEDGGKQVWIIDLPFVYQEKTESIKLEIDYQKQQETPEDEENWQVKLTLSPPNLGPIQCKISCHNQIIDTIFLTQNHIQAEQINLHLDYLKDKLEASGLKIGHLSANKTKSETKTIFPEQKVNLFDQQV